MEYQFESPLKNNMPTRPKRFNTIQDNKGLKYKFAKEKRDKDIRHARWSKLNREEVV